MKAKRILASVVALVVLMMGVTVIASAEGTALPAAVDGVITLTENVTLAQPVVIDETVTIEGKGFTLTYTGTDRAITVENTAVADLTIKDLNVVCSANSCQRGINYNTTGKLTLDNVSVSGKKVTYGVNLPSSANGAQINIADSDVTALIAVNVWGKNAIINIADTDLTSVDYSADEDYMAVKLSNNGTTSAEGTKVTITGGSITAKDENGAPSIAVMNNTETGSITVDDSTAVIGVTKRMVATVVYDGQDDFYCTDNLAEAVEVAAGDDSATIKLINNIELTEKIVVDKPVKVDGNGYKITTSAQKLFEVYADFDVSDLKMESTHEAGRCVDTRVDNIAVSIDNCELKTIKGDSEAQAVTVGGSEKEGLTLTITDSTIESEYVGIIMWVPAEVTIENTSITAWGTIYAKGISGAETSGSVITVVNSDLIATNDKVGAVSANNDFAAIIIEDDDVAVTVDEASTIVLDATGTYIQSAVTFKEKASNVTINGTVELKSDLTVVVLEMGADSQLIVTNDAVKAAVKAEGYDVADNGAVSVPEVRWVEDTDAGFYLDGETKLGLLRFLFSVSVDEEITGSGIKYIKPSDITLGKDADGHSVTGGTSSVFYGDINGIPAEAEGKRCIAIAYVTTESGKTYWSEAIEGVVDMTSQQFTKYSAGGAQ